LELENAIVVDSAINFESDCSGKPIAVREANNSAGHSTPRRGLHQTFRAVGESDSDELFQNWEAFTGDYDQCAAKRVHISRTN
jgi:hypothetical protein